MKLLVAGLVLSLVVLYLVDASLLVQSLAMVSFLAAPVFLVLALFRTAQWAVARLATNP